MTGKRKRGKKKTAPSCTWIFGSTPVLMGEDAEARNQLLADISSSVKPSDAVEDILVESVVDLTWEIYRWRRAKMHLIETVAINALAAAISEQKLDTGISSRNGPAEREETHRRLIRSPPPSQLEARRGSVSDVEAMNYYRKMITAPRESPQSSGTAIFKNSKVPEFIIRMVAGDLAAVKRVKEKLSASNLTIDSVISRALVENREIIEDIDHIITGYENRRNAILREIDRRRFLAVQMLREKNRNIEYTEFEHVQRKVVPRKVKTKEAV